MKPTVHPLTFLITLPSILALALPPFPTNATTNTTISPPSSPLNLTTNLTTIPPTHYYLQTRVKGNGDSSKTGLYVTGYHTAAGETDATLESIGVASIGYLNGSYQLFNYGEDVFPWGMDMDVYDYSAEWNFVKINAGYGSEGFFFNESGLQFATGEGFAGWLACDWFHGVPQLFWISFYDGDLFPSTCAQVDLLPVAA